VRDFVIAYVIYQVKAASSLELAALYGNLQLTQLRFQPILVFIETD